MTMKKSKTLQHIAAVAVVLLTLSLVFTVPVSAEENLDTGVVISIGSADELIELAQNITNGKDNYKGIQFSTVTKINLTDNINLEGKTWTPIGLWTGNQFATNGFNFDGEGKEIQNLYYNGPGTHVSGEAEYYLGFISNSSCNVNIKDVTFINPTIIGTPTGNMGGVNGVGTVIGCVHSGTVTLDNVDVVGGTVTGFGKVGGLIGFTQNAEGTSITIKNCNVGGYEDDGQYITFNGAYDIGGLVGLVQKNPAITLENNYVSWWYFLNEECEYITYAGQQYMMWDSETDGTVLEIPFAEAYVKFTGDDEVVGTANRVTGKPNLLINFASKAYNVTQVDITGDFFEYYDYDYSYDYDIINGISYNNVVTFENGKLINLEAAGEYVLWDNIEIGSTIEIDAGNVIIDLNGCGITGNDVDGYLFDVKNGATLSLLNTWGSTSIIEAQNGVKVRTGGSFAALETPEEWISEELGILNGKIILDVKNIGVSVYGHQEYQGTNNPDTLVSIEANTEIQTESCGIVIYGESYDTNSAGATGCYGVGVLVNGDITCVHPDENGTYDGTICITTNGYITEGNAVIGLGPDAVLSAATGNTGVVNTDDAPAIYSAGYAIWQIDGAQLSGDEAISMKQGYLTINDGSFTASGNYYDPSAANNDGTEMTGAAISITNTYGDGASGVNVIINGGAFRSEMGHAIFAGASDANKDSAGVLTSLLINEPVLEDDDVPPRFLLSFMSASGKDAIKLNNLRVDNEETEGNEATIVEISAGKYTTDVNTAYLATNYHVDKYEEFYIVNNERLVTISDFGLLYGVVNGNTLAFLEDEFTPTKEGYTFGGWYTDVDCTVKVDLNAPVTSDITLYGKWTENKKPVTDDSSSTGSKPGSSSSSSSSSSSKPSTPVKPETPAVPEAGEATVETEVTNGGEIPLETPTAGDAPAGKDEAKITGVVLPEGTDSEVAFIPVSEKPAPAGKEKNTKKVFEINVPKYEKGKPAVIKFTMTVAELTADGKTAGEVALWHQDEETGEWTKLVTTFVIIDGVVYFEAITYDFSPFAIVYEDTPVEEPTEEPTEEPATPAPILAVLAGLGAAVVLRRK